MLLYSAHISNHKHISLSNQRKVIERQRQTSTMSIAINFPLFCIRFNYYKDSATPRTVNHPTIAVPLYTAPSLITFFVTLNYQTSFHRRGYILTISALLLHYKIIQNNLPIAINYKRNMSMGIVHTPHTQTHTITEKCTSKQYQFSPSQIFFSQISGF